MLQVEHSAILSTGIKLPNDFKTFVLSIFEWLLKTGLTVVSNFQLALEEQWLSGQPKIKKSMVRASLEAMRSVLFEQDILSSLLSRGRDNQIFAVLDVFLLAETELHFKMPF